MRRSFICFLVAAAMALPATVCADSMTLVIEPLTQSIQPGGQVTFQGTLSVSGDGPENFFITGAGLSSGNFAFPWDDPINPDLLIFDDIVFWLNAPSEMSPVSTFTFDFFTITAPLTAIPGTYDGNFYVTAGDLLASADFLVTVVSPDSPAPLPAPGSLLLLGTGLAAFALRGRKWIASNSR